MEGALQNIRYDNTGKINLNDIYNEPDPVSYFSTLSKLDYRIPQEAKPHFQRLIEARRKADGSKHLKIIDLGCSYGVNGALLKHDLSMDDLCRRYTHMASHDRDELLARDRTLYAEPKDPALEIVGIDPADQAVSYAVDAGTLDGAVSTNLEKNDPTAEDAALIENADLLISTGCVGYVTETSLKRLVEASLKSRLWMAHFVLRMFDFATVEEMLGEHGYVTEKLDGLFPQRRFASAEEQQHVLDNLGRLEIDAADAEETGWYFAELHIARPEEDAKAMPLDKLLNRHGRNGVRRHFS
jgi:hypothetical protein